MELLWVLLALGLLGGGVIHAIMKSKAIEEARKVYLQSLAALKARPTDADLKQRTLALGREYSKLTRDNKGNTVFDEVALMNDINAACAAAAAHPSGASASTPGGAAEDRLRVLGDLKAKGLIDDAEFAKRRAEILNSI